MPKKQSLLEQTIEKLIEDLKPQDAKARPSEEGLPLLRLVDYKSGWNKFLKTVGRSTFASEFSEFHSNFWNWYWKITNLRYHNKSLSNEVLTYLAMWGRGNAKCLREDTLIQMANGTRRAIKDVKAGDSVCSFDADNKVVVDKVVSVWDSGVKDCLELKLKGGYTINLTAEHRLLTLSGWKQVKDLEPTDRIATPRKLLLPETGIRMDEEVTLLAYMLAEGGTTAGFTFTNSDKVIVDEFFRCCRVMGFEPKVGRGSKYGYRATGGFEWLKDNGMFGKKSLHKTIPTWVFSLPARQKWLFLAGLFDTDGYIATNQILGITLASREFIEQIQIILLSLGVRSKVSYSHNECAGAWILVVDKESIKNCSDNLPLLLKKSKLEQLATLDKYSLLDTYPYSVGCDLPTGINRQLQRDGVKLGKKNHPRLTRQKLRKAMALYEFPLWKSLEEADVAWSEIVSIEPVPRCKTFDIETEVHHNFVANGVVSHNSSSVEWASIVEGAVGLKGYVLYVSATQVSANAHIESVRKRLEGADIGLYFPHLSEPLIGTHGNQYGWRQEFLITKGGWAIRPVGLDVGIRGAKSEDLRPTMIIFDDIDSHKDTLATVQSKIETISREIIPAGTPNTIYLLANNLVHENSITNQIHTGKTDILANHIPSFVPTFSELDIETEINETTGKTRHIIKHAVPTWKHFDINEAQRFLDNSGLFSFYAEYQHDFKLDSTDKVLPEYLDYPTHVISWSQFEEKYKTRHTVPAHWQKGIGLDLGYTDGHISAWTWLAVGAQDSGLPNAHFCYRGMTFVGTSVDEQAEQVLNRLKVKQGIGMGVVNEFKQGYSLQKMSHEKLGERYQLNRKYNFSFSAFKKGKEEGIPEWRELLRVDKRKPHPFHIDMPLLGEDGLPTGEYTIGRPNFFYVVEDSQLITASDDFGLAIHRSQAFNWKRRKVKLTVTGLSDDQPMKIEDDCFVAGTLVRTGVGEIPIENVSVGDWIWTRKGLRRCVKAGITKQATDVVTVEFPNGKSLTGTPTHPVFVQGEWRNLDSLRVKDIVNVWQNTFTSSLTASAFTGIQNLDTLLRETTIRLTTQNERKVSHPCTLRYGNLFMVIFLRVITFIIKTVIPLTTTSLIWSASLPKNIEASIESPLPTLKLRTTAAEVWKKPSRRLWSGGAARKVVRGIENTVGRCRRIFRFLISNAISVANTFRVKNQEVAFAGTNVRNDFVPVMMPPQTNAFVPVAEKNLSLAKASRTSTAQNNAAVGQRILEKRKVYNLTVDDVPEYYANGILVHNCSDSLRGILAERLLDSTPKTLHQRVEDALPEFYSPENMETMRGMEDFGGILLARQMQAQEIIKAEEQRVRNVLDMLTRSLAPDPRGSSRGKRERPKSLWRN